MRKLLLATAAIFAGSVGHAASPLAVQPGLQSEPLQHVQAHGYYTYCWVNVAPDLQMAVVNAQDFNACQSAALKCLNGRPYESINFNSFAVLQSAGTVELCELPY